jgi:hypothetical protein
MKSPLFTLLVLVLAVSAATQAKAQVQGGTIYGTISDEQGAVLPGATLTLVGSDVTQTQVTGTDGNYRFLNLAPGPYTLSVALAGFTKTVRENIQVRVGVNAEVPFTLKLASVEQSITVTAETPLVDPKTTGTSTNFTQAELSGIPTSRDPWALLRTVPGVMVDRVNIAGNETGQQSNFQSKGTRPQDAVWTMDGVIITDQAAIGSSPTYFNYDNFDEVQVSTSGQDIRQPTGGVGLNFVVKRGTNQFKGDARGYFTNDSLEGQNIPAELVAAGVTPETADHNKQISDYGFELGGPIVRDRAWIYGSISNQDIQIYRRATSSIDRTKLKNYDVKGTWKATRKDTVSVLWFLGDKQKNGRSPGTSGINFDAPTATWNQADAFTDNAPHGLWKFEDNHTFGSSLFVSGRYAYFNTGFGLVPIGGLDTNAGESLVLGRSFGSTRQNLNKRPQHSVSGEGNFFREIGHTSNDFKFGGMWRRSDALSDTVWPGDMMRALENSATDTRARIYREGNGTNRVQFFDLYAGDTVSLRRLTIDAGVRYDRQWGSALPSSAAASVAFPDLVPAITFAGYRAPFTWNNVSPRAGITYALDSRSKTIARASFSRYAGQLETGIIGFSNPSGSNGYVDVPWTDLNGDHLAQPNEVDITKILAFGGGFNPADPTAVSSANKIDPNLKAPVTTSVVAGLDRELMPNLAVQVSYSYTRTSNYNGNFTNFFTPWNGLTAADYIDGPSLTGTIPGTSETYDIPTFLPDPAKVKAAGNSRLLTNQPGYYSYYNGLEVSVVKRMANRWMMRVGTAYNLPKENYGSTPLNDAGNPTRTDLNPLVNGGDFVVRSGGSGSGDIFVDAKWQFNVNGLYSFPHDINVGANVFGRQGYPFPVYRSASLGLDGTYRILLTPDIDTMRLKNLWDTDLRVSKVFRASRLNVEAVADLFNLFNANTELVRNRNAASASFQQLSQNLSPRIVRFGLKVGF